ncbi:hypothetical protein QCA50_013708 [Cerrena zonata]|uniref:Uncharacterized protein n=1 Tax=Cerrena zonata TaxID=2478898 RepID=A0AAW0FQ95_9APHY
MRNTIDLSSVLSYGMSLSSDNDITLIGSFLEENLRHISMLEINLLTLPYESNDWSSLQLSKLNFIESIILHISFLSGMRAQQDFGWISLTPLLLSLTPLSSLRSISFHILLPDLGSRTLSCLRDFCWSDLDSVLSGLQGLKNIIFSLHPFLKPGIGGETELDVVAIIQNALPSLNKRNLLTVQFCAQDWKRMHNFSYWLVKNTCCR